MTEEKWWVGRGVDCIHKLYGNLCSCSWTLGEKDEPVFSHSSSGGKKEYYEIQCPLCGCHAYIEK